MLVVAAVVAGPTGVRANEAEGRAVLGDVEPSADLDEEAAVVSLLYRSMLESGTRPLASRTELALGLDTLAGKARRGVLIVEPGLARGLLEKLHGDRLFWARLSRRGARLAVEGQIVGPDGSRIADVKVEAADGDVTPLARKVARDIASRMGLVFREVPEVSMARVRPLAFAHTALARKDAAAAARELELATPGSAEKLPG